MAIASVTALVNAFPGHTYPFVKANVTNLNYWISYALVSGTPVATTSVTGTCDRTTKGALPISNAGPGQSLYVGKYILSVATVPTHAFPLSLYDRLYTKIGISTNTTSLQPIASTYPARVTSYGGIELWAECTTGIGTTPGILTVNYTNELGNAATTTIQVPASLAGNTGQSFWIPLATGDKGITALTSCQLGSSAVGALTLVLQTKIMNLYPPTSLTSNTRDAIGCGLVSVPNDAALYFMAQSSGIAYPYLAGSITLISA